MRFRTVLTYLALLPLSACTKGCKDYDNNEEFARAKLPAYTDTGAGTMGSVLGTQTWTVLGSHYLNRIGYPWEVNRILLEGNYSVPPYLSITGEMTGVRDSKPFYDMSLSLVLRLNDSLPGLHLLGSQPRASTNRPAELIVARNLLSFADYTSRSSRPVRLLVRKYDSQQRIVSGTFEGMLYESYGPDSLAVTDGRFDVRY